MALRIEKAFGPDMNHLLRMQLAYDVAQTRMHSKGVDVKRYVPANDLRANDLIGTSPYSRPTTSVTARRLEIRIFDP